MFNQLTRLVFILVVLLTACGSPPSATPLPTPQAVFLAYPPELRFTADALAACARQDPGIAIYLKEEPAPLRPEGQSSLYLVTGDPPQAFNDWHATLLATYSLVVIVNVQNPIASLSAEQLRDIWSGNSSNWQSVDGSPGSIQVWTFPDGSPLRQLFDSVVLPTVSSASSAWLAPDPQAMLEAVAADPLAAGYLPADWLENAPANLRSSVEVPKLPDEVNLRLQVPLLALTHSEPQGALRALLLCYQSGQ